MKFSTSPAARSEEKRLFLQAKFICSNDKTQNVFSLMLITHCQKTHIATFEENSLSGKQPVFCCRIVVAFLWFLLLLFNFLEIQVTPNFFSFFFFFFNKQHKIIRYRAWQTERNKLFRRFGYNEKFNFLQFSFRITCYSCYLFSL